MAIAIVSIYHAHDLFRPHKFGSPIELAYSYEANAETEVEPEFIYRRNNAVTGDEENVKAKARSLSVGDVVVVGFNDKLPTIFSVATIGMTDMTEDDLERSIASGCPGCPVCDSVSNG